MEKLRATWIQRLTAAQYRADQAATADNHEQGQADAYEQVLRDTDAYNEYLSLMIADVTTKHRKASDAYYTALQGRQRSDLPHLGDQAKLLRHMLDQLHQLQHLKGVNR